MLLALSSAQKGGLAGMGAAFVVFALACSMLVPRYWPDFPGRLLGAFVGVSVAFTAAMMLTVFFVAKESESAEARGTEPPAAPGEQPPPLGSEQPPSAPKGNAAAGRKIFTSANIGCFGCHTLKAANAKGTVGPNLDQAKPGLALIVERVTNGKPPMPAFKGTLTQQEIQDVAAFVYESTHGGS